MKYSITERLISDLSNQQINLITDGVRTDMDQRIAEVKADEWKYIYGRLEMDEAWFAGFNTACILLGAGGGFSTNSDGSIDCVTEYEITQNLAKS